MRGSILTLGLVLLSGVATAQETLERPGAVCAFETECYEDGACDDSAFEMDLFDPSAPVGARLQQGLTAETEFGRLQGYTVTRAPGTAVHVFEGDGAIYFLSVGPDAARLSVHLEGPEVVTYLGACEAPG